MKNSKIEDYNFTDVDIKKSFSELKGKMNFLQKVLLSKKQSKYATRLEVAKELKLSLPTIIRYTNIGLLKEYVIGRRHLFIWNEVYESVEQKTKTIKQ